MVRSPVTKETAAEHVRTLTLNRPDVMNAYNEPQLTELVGALEDADADDAVRAVVLTGAGEAFCAGIDLNEMPLDPGIDFAEYEAGLGLFQAVVRTLRSMSTPVVAAVNGYALGAGCDTALACDFRVAAESAVMGESFVDVGLIPGDGGTYLLPRLIGEERAKELVMTGRKLAGAEIDEWGLAREVVPDDELLDAAIEFAETLAAQPPVAVGEIKALVNESFDVDLEAALRRATRAQRIASETYDHEEALRAFQEGRNPEFEGR